VILFDEIEKAHSDVFNLLLQILDDGRLTDGHGRTVNFKNTVIIMTSNIATPFIQEFSGKELEDKVMEALKARFRPEFLNRVDEIITFNPLSMEELKKIVGIQMRYLQDRLAERKLTISVNDSVKELIASKGFDPVFGARPVKRTIQRLVEDPLSIKILNGEFSEGDTIKADVSVSDGTIVFSRG
jgi:ATP-dependent Clp protease ATP-binding subunit ClpB